MVSQTHMRCKSRGRVQEVLGRTYSRSRVQYVGLFEEGGRGITGLSFSVFFNFLGGSCFIPPHPISHWVHLLQRYPVLYLLHFSTSPCAMSPMSRPPSFVCDSMSRHLFPVGRHHRRVLLGCRVPEVAGAAVVGNGHHPEAEALNLQGTRQPKLFEDSSEK